MKWLMLWLALPAFAQTAGDSFRPLTFLIGDWIGEGGGGPGEGSGSCSFHYDVQRRVVVRKNHAEYPAKGDRAAYSHDDLMIVYEESGVLRAIYFDSENHVIRYAVEGSGDEVRFLSEPAANQPRYRLTYRKTSSEATTLQFDIAPPGKDFQSYIVAKLRRAGSR